ncbi:MAG: NUDIX hydrolase [Hyphomonadaceae bacterium]
MSASADAPKPASTVLIVRDGEGLEVLMVRRSAGMAFGASAWVFPGGKVAAADADPAWDALSSGSYDAYARSLRVAAAREVFEESGILLATRGADDLTADDCSVFEGERGRVEEDPRRFLELIGSAGLSLSLEKLAPFAHWITPSFEPRRFDTHFFLVRAPSSQVARHDGREAVDHQWVTPTDVLQQRQRGEAKLMFPTRLNLEVLGRSANATEAEAATRARTVVTVEPQVVERADGKVLMIPAEAGYGLTEERIGNVLG